MAAVWISEFDPVEVRARVDAADPGQPLAGMTFDVKDNVDVAGLPTTAGCPDFAYRPERNAPVVQRLLDAGTGPFTWPANCATTNCSSAGPP